MIDMWVYCDATLEGAVILSHGVYTLYVVWIES